MSTARARPPTSRGAFPRLAAALLGAALLWAPPARAEDGPEGEETTEELEQKIRAQMAKILKLMRDNEQALLEASVGGRAKPPPVEVAPPAVPPGGSGEAGMGAAPPKEGGGPPPEGGEAVRREMERLLEQTRSQGGAVPKEIEALVRMIPARGGGGPSSGGQPESGQTRKQGEKPKEAEKKPGEGQEPQDAKDGRDPKTGKKPPPQAPTDDPRANEDPPWWAELPEETRRVILGGSVESVPPAYRPLLERYRKWLAEKARAREP